RDQIAVLHASELRDLDELSWGALTEQVAAAAAGLRELGIRRGDRVVADMPNIPETVIAFLAVASIGAGWAGAAPAVGARSVIDRCAQIQPKLMLTVDGYRHGGRDFERLAVAEAILAELPTVERVVLVPYLAPSAQAGRHARFPHSSWEQLLERGRGAE